MQVLHGFSSTSRNKLPEKGITPPEVFSVYYHNIFEYPLTFSEVIKWQPKNPPKIRTSIQCKNGYYFVQGREGLIYKREIKKRHSQKKIKIAGHAAKIMSIIPFIKMVGISGSVAMNNAKKDSDIDLIIITKKGRLWTSRIIVYLLLNFLRLPLRVPQSREQRDRLCLNIWLDEDNLKWNPKQRNFYTAHEILQVIPLVNKDKTYEKWLKENRWVLNFWPNVVDVDSIKYDSNEYTKPMNTNPIETLAYKVQVKYMKAKISREVIKPGKAIFHPQNLSKTIVEKYT
ncbi:MAG: hypothetical protein ACD_13C00093G0039 [uncultured bacterium]|nr:MAG: hypothetical protein ACD_13C00093G0039 [uncultured bacterium]